MLAGDAPTLPPRAGRKPRVPLTQVLSALTFHVMKGAGTLGEHFAELFQTPLADSSLADRRARLPWEIFAELMHRMLRPRATADGEPEAFWRGWRLLALDGTQFSLTNAPAVKRYATKARTRRGRAAIVLASALLAVERIRAADGMVPVLRVSFAKMLPIVEGMWFTLDIAAPVLTEDQKHFILTQMYERMRRHLTPKRRARSCPRAVRQPVTKWPRLLKNTSVDGPFEFTIL